MIRTPATDKAFRRTAPRPINPHWKQELLFLVGLFLPFWLGMPLLGLGQVMNIRVITIISVVLIMIWMVTGVIVLLWAMVNDIIHDSGSY